jgi:hypothetical protein
LDKKYFEAKTPMIEKRLKTKVILFGHRSVGKNIIQGIEEYQAKIDLKRQIVFCKIDRIEQILGNGFYHFLIGQNGHPKKKIKHFKTILQNQKYSKTVNIAFFKLCYVDIDKNTDVEEIFNYYINTIEQIKHEHQKIKVVHITTPLCSHKKGLKGILKRVLQTDFNNIKRNLYNEKIRKKYKGKDPIYDLATIESTYPDGRRSSFNYNGKTYYSLANEYTYDGGHLNEVGRKWAAYHLLELLSEIDTN